MARPPARSQDRDGVAPHRRGRADPGILREPMAAALDLAAGRSAVIGNAADKVRQQAALGSLSSSAWEARMAGAAQAGDAASIDDGRGDFDFLMGAWNCRHRRLRTLLAGADDWYEFAGTSVARKILSGLGNIDENAFPSEGFAGITLRLFDPARRLWAIYWANSLTGVLFPPVFGRFANGEGRFHGEDTHDGEPIKVAYLWSRITPVSCRWEQSFSRDGQAWETNWIMDFTRA
jgi:hypothetical protein